MAGVRGANPIWFMVDLAAKAFTDNFYMWVLENTLPYIPATVYHDPELNVAWTNPIQFLANGTLPNDIYFEEGKVYRLEFRENNGLVSPTQNDPLIYEVNNYMPGAEGEGPIENVGVASDNQISNPQFAVINFESPLTLNSIGSQDIEIAPGWFLELSASGTGNVTIERIALNDTNSNPTNAPYALHITTSGWALDGVKLRQRFNQNGMLWENKYVSSSVTAKVNGANQSIKATLQNSNGTPIAPELLAATTVTTDWNEFKGVASIGTSDNPDVPPAAYIDYLLYLPSTGDIYITSVQVVVQGDQTEAVYIQDSVDRQLDHTFHYYSPQLKFKPIPSLLTGWDFPLNPFQLGVSGNVTTTPAYIADQTIAACNTGTLTYSRVSTSLAPMFTTSTNNQSFFIQQYLKGAQAFEMTLSHLSVFLNTYQLNHQGTLCKVYLYYNSGGGTIPTLPTNIGTINDDGTFNLTASGWTQIVQLNGFPNNFGINGLSVINEKFLNGYLGSNYFGSVSDANFAIVVTFLCPSSGTSVVLNQVGLMKGDIATPPAPQTTDQVLRECQYYFEKSQSSGFGGGLTDSIGCPMSIFITLASAGAPANYFMYAAAFGFQYKNVKRAMPLFTPISTLMGASGFVTHRLFYTGAANAITFKEADILFSSAWSSLIGLSEANFLPTITSTIDTATAGTNNNPYNSAYLTFQYLLDARIGVV